MAERTFSYNSTQSVHTLSAAAATLCLCPDNLSICWQAALCLHPHEHMPRLAVRDPSDTIRSSAFAAMHREAGKVLFVLDLSLSCNIQEPSGTGDRRQQSEEGRQEGGKRRVWGRGCVHGAWVQAPHYTQGLARQAASVDKDRQHTGVRSPWLPLSKTARK